MSIDERELLLVVYKLKNTRKRGRSHLELFRDLKCLDLIDFEILCDRRREKSDVFGNETVIILENLLREREQVIKQYGVVLDAVDNRQSIEQLKIEWLFGNFTLLDLNDNNDIAKKTGLNIKWGEEMFLCYSERFLPHFESPSLTLNQAEELLLKFLRVIEHLPLSQRGSVYFEGRRRYQVVLSLIFFCYKFSIKNSALVVSFLKRALGFYDILERQIYPEGFLEYVLAAANHQKFDVMSFDEVALPSSKRFSSFSQIFCVFDAFEDHDDVRALILLQYGNDIFLKDLVDPQMKTGLLPILRKLYKMDMLTKHLLVTLVLIINYKDSKEQQEIFRHIWNTLPQPYVKSDEIRTITNIPQQYESYHPIFDDYLQRLCQKYENNFPDYALGGKEPRSLKHLCRCSIREILKLNYFLPNGIFRLKLPNKLKYYLNLI